MAFLSIEMSEVLFAFFLSSLPAGVMLLGSMVAILCMTQEANTTLSIAQNFSAGIIIAAISTELVSKMVESSSGPMGTLSMSIGFFGAFVLLTVVKERIPEDKDKQIDAPNVQPIGEEEEEARNEQSNVHSVQPTASLVQSTRLQKASSSLSMGASRISPVPWAFALPIYIDCVMDGFLLGVIAAASHPAGAVMSVATSIEMGFLGITFGALIKACGWKCWPLALLGPVILLSACVLTALGAGAITEHRTILEGMLAFGASSLLFLVTQELLEEARDNGSKWYTSIWLFIGFFVVVLSESLLK
eukprot:TRINITY_DN19195_c0_g1_i1.p1 TRINITY_DN19195_c0_g1~~TRINITY_DN19195_c0_g1_i1.p1  ORF type:complete len:303 (+),score=55.94 TRINITY_DN19195_c0_g1_i1:91-999(+)